MVISVVVDFSMSARPSGQLPSGQSAIGGRADLELLKRPCGAFLVFPELVGSLVILAKVGMPSTGS